MSMNQFTPRLWVVKSGDQHERRKKQRPEPTSGQPMSGDPRSIDAPATKLPDAAVLTRVDDAGSADPALASPSSDKATKAVRPTSPQEMPGPTGHAEDPAILIGLSLWTARQHERYLARARGTDGRSVLHSYPAILVDALRRHADAGDPNCRLVLDWLSKKGMLASETASASHKGAV